MKIKTTKNKITFEFDRFQKRINPYMINKNGNFEDVGKYPTFTGLIVRHRKNGNYYDEIGFAITLDMDYADKPDQVGDFIVRWYGEEKEFIEECKKLDIEIHEITI